MSSDADAQRRPADLVRRLDHVGLVVRDLEATVGFLTAIGLVVEGTARNDGAWVDCVVGLDGVRSEIAYLRAPGGGSAVEVARFDAPADAVADAERSERDAGSAPLHRPGLRHLCFEVGDLDAVLARVRTSGHGLVGEVVVFDDVYRLCFVRGPEGLLVELAQPIGGS